MTLHCVLLYDLQKTREGTQLINMAYLYPEKKCMNENKVIFESACPSYDLTKGVMRSLKCRMSWIKLTAIDALSLPIP